MLQHEKEGFPATRLHCHTKAHKPLTLGVPLGVCPAPVAEQRSAAACFRSPLKAALACPPAHGGVSCSIAAALVLRVPRRAFSPSGMRPQGAAISTEPSPGLVKGRAY